MNTSALLFIILDLWIFTLQSKISHLEKLVNGLRNKKQYLPLDEEEYISTEDVTLKDELPEVSNETVSLEAEELQSSVEKFKASRTVI